jgi:hypothetical protein
VQYETRTVAMPSFLKIAYPTVVQACALCVVLNALLYGAVVVESYAPYCRSGRNNALYVVRDVHCCNAVVELAQLTCVPNQAIRHRWMLTAAPSSEDAPRRLPKDAPR